MSQENFYMHAAHDLDLIAQGPSAGVVYWKPAGMRLYENLKKFIREYHERYSYQEVKSPSMVISEVFEQSGHMDKYRDNMFFVQGGRADDAAYAMRPMSCPNHILLYQSDIHSYKQLPVKYFEFGEVFRNEASGSLQLLFRQRQFSQDDSHIFARPDQVISVLQSYLAMSKEVYKMLGFEDISYAVSLRPDQRFGSDELWDKAEQALRQACVGSQVEFFEIPKGGAFYGPKIEMQVKDNRGRAWQLGVIQLDYVLPERFGLEFVNSDNNRERPVLLHHAVLGSLERMIGILLESFGKELPSFVHPWQDAVVYVSDKSKEYAKSVAKVIPGSVFQDSEDPLGKKLQYWRNKGVRKIWVVGESEASQFKENGEMWAVCNEGSSKQKIKIR